MSVLPEAQWMSHIYHIIIIIIINRFVQLHKVVTSETIILVVVKKHALQFPYLTCTCTQHNLLTNEMQIMKTLTFFRRSSWWFNKVQLPKMSVDHVKILSSPTSATSHWIDHITYWKYVLSHKVAHVFCQRFIQLFNKNQITNTILQIRISSPQLFFLVEILQHQTTHCYDVIKQKQYLDISQQDHLLRLTNEKFHHSCVEHFL